MWVDDEGTRDIGTAPTGLPWLLGAPVNATKGLGEALRAPVRFATVAVAQWRWRATARWLQP